MTLLARLEAAWWRWRCHHWWRPARTSKGPARYCPLCETTEPLTEELFFAYFGRHWR